MANKFTSEVQIRVDQAEKYWLNHFCQNNILRNEFNLTKSQAQTAIDKGFEKIKHLKKMQQMIESGGEHNPETEIEHIKTNY